MHRAGLTSISILRRLKRPVRTMGRHPSRPKQQGAQRQTPAAVLVDRQRTRPRDFERGTEKGGSKGALKGKVQGNRSNLTNCNINRWSRNTSEPRHDPARQCAWSRLTCCELPRTRLLNQCAACARKTMTAHHWNQETKQVGQTSAIKHKAIIFHEVKLSSQCQFNTTQQKDRGVLPSLHGRCRADCGRQKLSDC